MSGQTTRQCATIFQGNSALRIAVNIYALDMEVGGDRRVARSSDERRSRFPNYCEGETQMRFQTTFLQAGTIFVLIGVAPSYAGGLIGDLIKSPVSSSQIM
jgi:hypothetical protein